MAKYLFLIFGLLWANDALTQLVVNASNSPSNIVNLARTGITISNVQIECDSQGIGTFDGTNTNLGLTSGVILTTGKAVLAKGHPTQGNNMPDAYARILFDQPDDDLAAEINVNPNETDDACRVMFDIKSTSNMIIFEYVFGSEEYEEWIDYDYNDAFGFMISGPGFNPKTNVAKVPNTNDRVSIKSINANKNSIYYYLNEPCNTGSCLQYDGYTRPLTARIDVIPNQTYQIKLVICDVGDSFNDSGVFIQSIRATESPLENIYHIQPPTLTVLNPHAVVLHWQENNCSQADTPPLKPFQIIQTTDFKTFDTLNTHLKPCSQNNYQYHISNANKTAQKKTAATQQINYYQIYTHNPQTNTDYASDWQKIMLPDSKSKLRIFPNPSKDILNIQGLESSLYRIRVYNALGQIADETIINNMLLGTSDALPLSLSFPNINAGIYNIEIIPLLNKDDNSAILWDVNSKSYLRWIKSD